MALQEEVLNELKYDKSKTGSIDVGDIVLVYKGNVYHVSIIDNSDENKEYALNIIRMLCRDFTGMTDRFFNEDGSPKVILTDFSDFTTLDIGKIISAMYNFEDCPRVLCFEVDEIENETGLAISDSSHMDIINSKELHDFLQTDYAKRFRVYQIGSKEYTYDQLVRNESYKQNVPIADKVYHGTCLAYIEGILTKGIRSIAENSKWNVRNDGYVVLASSFDTASAYASMYARETGSMGVVVEVSTANIDKDRIVNDWDFAHEFTSDYDNAPYGNLKKQSNFKGSVANNKDRYGTKFSKFGYKGIIMPSAITAVYVRTREGYKKYDKENALKMSRAMQNESKQRLNEWWYPEFYNQLPDKIRLYHGTDMMALNDIIEQGVISAYNGHRHGETHGVNWFSLQLTGNYGKGTYFSIEVPKSDFENHIFHFMNNSDVTSENREIPIDKYNLRIEKIGGMDVEDFQMAWERMKSKGGEDIFDFIEYLNRVNREFKEWLPTVDYPVVIRLFTQLFGSKSLRDAGIVESRLNEAEASDVNLSSFKVKDELHPRFWIDGRINSRVRTRLLDIANDFIEELSISWVKPHDITFTGSLANYNWSRYSDIDLHIVIDFKKVYKDTDFVDDYFKSKKDNWNEAHGQIRIFGFPVEISVEDKNQPGVSSGVYSLNHDRWIKEPDNFDDARLNEQYVKEYAARVMTKIEKLEDRCASADTDDKLMRIGKRAKELFDSLKKLRKEALARSGEMASGNIIWKILRRTGYLDRMWEVIDKSYNKMRSLK